METYKQELKQLGDQKAIANKLIIDCLNNKPEAMKLVGDRFPKLKKKRSFENYLTLAAEILKE